jgi:hypothetical protein
MKKPPDREPWDTIDGGHPAPVSFPYLRRTWSAPDDPAAAKHRNAGFVVALEHSNCPPPVQIAAHYPIAPGRPFMR